MISLIKSHWTHSKFSFHETLAVRKRRKQWAEMDPSLIFSDEEILREAALSAEDPTWDGSAALGRLESFLGKKFVDYLKGRCFSVLELFSPYSQRWLWRSVCDGIFSQPQVGYLHAELSIRFKASDIKMIHLASQRQAPIMPDHFLCPLLTLHLRFMQMHHYEPSIRRRDDGATLLECVPNNNAARSKWEENEKRKKFEEEEEKKCRGWWMCEIRLCDYKIGTLFLDPLLHHGNRAQLHFPIFFIHTARDQRVNPSQGPFHLEIKR